LNLLSFEFDDEQIGIGFFGVREIAADAGQRPAGAGRADECTELALGLAPDLGARGIVVRLTVRER